MGFGVQGFEGLQQGLRVSPCDPGQGFRVEGEMGNLKIGWDVYIPRILRTKSVPYHEICHSDSSTQPCANGVYAALWQSREARLQVVLPKHRLS